MFYKYEIKNNGVEDILYLYLTMAYEFSKELAFNSSDKELTRRTKNFIKNNNIQYNGTKVYLVIDGIVVKSLDVMSKDNEIEILTENLYYSNDHFLVTIKLDDQSNIEIPLKDYLAGVLATNMLPNLELETLKALSILYRTHVFHKMSTDKYISATDEFLVYRPISYYKLTWIDNYNEIVDKINLAIKDTDCLFITYNNSYILPFIHYSNSGQTFSSDKYPYLTPVKSLWDLASPYYVEINDFDYEVLSKIFKTDISFNTNIDILEVDKKNFVKKVKIADSIFTGEEFMNLLNLKSLNMSFIINRDYLRIITKGWGNGLGLSIFGANELARNGCDYANILKYYFPKIQLNKYIKELS